MRKWADGGSKDRMFKGGVHLAARLSPPKSSGARFPLRTAVPSKAIGTVTFSRGFHDPGTGIGTRRAAFAGERSLQSKVQSSLYVTLVRHLVDLGNSRLHAPHLLPPNIFNYH